MPDLKLGKRPATSDHRDLLLARYVDVAATLPTIPASFGHEKGITWPMCGNGPDQTVRTGFGGAGDCVFAGACHETQLWRHAAGAVPAAFNGHTAISDYSAVTGYVIGNDATDQGTSVRAALRYRQKIGIIDTAGKRHKIGAYLALDPGNVAHLLVALYLFEAVGIRIEFPASAMDQFNAGKTWRVVKGSPNEGGHYIPLVARRTTRSLDCVTWARKQRMTSGFYSSQCDEAWAILSLEALNATTGKTAEGVDLATLKRDLAAL